MSEWYYARGGQQNGPISYEQLVELAHSGGLDRSKDLVWNATMKDWLPVGQVPGLFDATVTSPGAAADEIVPGNEPLVVGDCVKRGFELTKRHFGILLLVALAYLGVRFGFTLILILMDSTSTLGHTYQNGGSPLSMVVSLILSVFLGLGLTRVGLNLISGKEVKVGQLFGEGRKLLRALGAQILLTLMIALGCLLLIVPGIYLALRFGFCVTAIVDRDLGIIDSFKYSSSITANNRMLLLGLLLLCGLIGVAGLMACGVGLIFAAPMAWLTHLVAYRWLQYGRRAVLDA
ncbi:MAG: DUF4339 domain-containing protein [Verrucomicrobiota bacterium]